MEFRGLLLSLFREQPLGPTYVSAKGDGEDLPGKTPQVHASSFGLALDFVIATQDHSRLDARPWNLGRASERRRIVAMSAFTEAEIRYLAGGRQLGRIATVGADGTPHVVPVAWIYNAARDTIDVGGSELERSKKFRDVARTGRAAIVIDDLASTDPWRPRGIEIRGRGEAIALPTPLIRIHPERIVTWGIEPGRSARTVAR